MKRNLEVSFRLSVDVANVDEVGALDEAWNVFEPFLDPFHLQNQNVRVLLLLLLIMVVALVDVHREN